MSGEGFLSRWSRRKREAEAEPLAEASVEPAPETPVVPAPAACPVPGIEEFDLASLPRIEDLTVTSDLGPFLRPGIPAALRAAALRRMWSVDPAIRDFIGCVDYQWDFNTPGGLPAGFASELGGEVKKLLAQAIGQRDEEPEAKMLVERNAETVEPASPLRLDPPGEPAELPPAITLVEGTPADVTAEDHPPRPPKRHGSALPP